MTNSELIGLWRLETVNLPLVGIRRDGDGQDLFFEFMADGRAVVHLHGETYPTAYKVFNHCIIFDRVELAALRLKREKELLCLSNYHGVTLLFRRAEDGSTMPI